ncbi:hypothetical protein [Halegenticoccus tardaugens]|uniref:hypothetical protein n=1 Tax=Halegenticoccus tardaugens TaxID=2071624 RepID=UPI00100AF5E2|nr:hypothetical protein [Halegenticoccus tardaugens]
MEGRYVLLGVVGFVAVAAAAGTFALGDPGELIGEPATDDGTEQTTAMQENTASKSDGDSAAGGQNATGSGETADGDDKRFRFAVERIEECGTTCRDVTVVVTNTGDRVDSEVVVVSRISADGDELWRGQETVDSMDRDERVTRTERVDLGYADAYKVQRNDGYVTIDTTIRWAGGEETFTERRKVT